MTHKTFFVGVMLFSLTLPSCSVRRSLAPPPPGWEENVKDILIDASSFPQGWWADIERQADDYPRANYTHRYFFDGRPGFSSQSVWRAYIISDAKEKYRDLRNSQFEPNGPLPEGDLFLPFTTPEELEFNDLAADEFYLACGWWTVASCQVVARYRNYVVYLYLEHETSYEDHHTEGLTYAEMRPIIEAVDAKFVNAFNTFDENENSE